MATKMDKRRRRIINIFHATHMSLHEHSFISENVRFLFHINYNLCLVSVTILPVEYFPSSSYLGKYSELLNFGLLQEKQMILLLDLGHPSIGCSSVSVIFPSV